MNVTLVVALTLAATAAALIAGVAAWELLLRRAPAQRRLREIESASSGPATVLAPLPLTDEPAGASRRIRKLIPRSPANMNRLRRRLVKAGYPGSSAVVFYAVLEVICPVVLGAAAYAWLPRPQNLLMAGVAGVAGFLLPGFVLAFIIAARQKRIRNGLPDALDLMVVCVEAGSALDQAIVKSAEELGIAHPDLARELRLVNTEIRAGKPRVEAFRNLAERTGVDEVRALVTMLVQTDRFGTSVAQALRTHADALRTKRRQEAEERAAKLGVKLVFPLVFCLLPALFVVVLGPAAIRIYRVLIQGVAGR